MTCHCFCKEIDKAFAVSADPSSFEHTEIKEDTLKTRALKRSLYARNFVSSFDNFRPLEKHLAY